jgi:hypothetical protein
MTKSARLEEIEIKHAEMRMKLTARELAKFEGEERSREHINRVRQEQLGKDQDTNRRLRNFCKHRQGGTLKDLYHGKGPTALNVITMPGGDWDKMITCLVCPGIWHSPNPLDMATALRKGETEEQRDRRVVKYQADLEEFNAILKQAEDRLSSDETVMDSGTKIVKIDLRTGLRVPVLRPCDETAA